MIEKELKLISEKNVLREVFSENGILYQCAGPDGYSLRSEPSGTVLCVFILSGNKILMAEQGAGAVPGVSVRALSKGCEVTTGLCTYRLQLSKRMALPGKRLMVIVGLICAAIVAGASMIGFIDAGEGNVHVVKPATAKKEAPVENQAGVKRLDLLLKLDEGQGEVRLKEKVVEADVFSEADSREAFQLYERGLALLDAGKYFEAADKLSDAKTMAGKLQIVPPYMRMIDETVSRARAAIEEAQAAAVAEMRSYVDMASVASPGESLKIISEAKAKFGAMPIGLKSDLLKNVRDELDRLHRLNISTLLAKAHTLERLEGCQAADSAYRETLEKYGSVDKLLAQEIRGALDRCGGGGR